MATLLNRSFQFYEMALSRMDDGDSVLSLVSKRTARGTVQPLNGQETVTYLAGSRDTGSVKVYSSASLTFRSEDGQKTSFIKHAGSVYELTQQIMYQNVGVVAHFKYIASLVPPSQVPEALNDDD